MVSRRWRSEAWKALGPLVLASESVSAEVREITRSIVRKELKARVLLVRDSVRKIVAIRLRWILDDEFLKWFTNNEIKSLRRTGWVAHRLWRGSRTVFFSLLFAHSPERRALLAKLCRAHVNRRKQGGSSSKIGGEI